MIFKPGDLVTFCCRSDYSFEGIPVYQDINNFKDWFMKNWVAEGNITRISIAQIGMILESINVLMKRKLFYRVIVEDASIYYVHSSFVLPLENQDKKFKMKNE